MNTFLMSYIYNTFINVINDNVIKFNDFNKIKDIDDYISRLKANILSETVLDIKIENPKIIKCKHISPKVLAFECDIDTDMKGYVIGIDNLYYIVTDSFYNNNTNYQHMTLNSKIKQNQQYDYIHANMHICIANKLHQYSSLIFIERNIVIYSKIVESIMYPNIYTTGVYAQNNVSYNSANSDQLSAIMAISNTTEAIHGPPGTGKSTTIVNLIKLRISNSQKILCTAIQNQAIESLVEKMTKENLNFTVIGNPKRLKTISVQKSLLTEFNNDTIIINFNNKIDKVHKRALLQIKKEGRYDELYDQKILKYKQKINVRQKEISKKYDIFISTISSSSKVYTYVHQIDTIIIDEAGYVTEMSILPLIILKPINIILIGDHKQLKPFNHSSYLERIMDNIPIYYESLLERFIKNNCKLSTLNIQYRMTPIICNLVSSLFYDNKLISFCCDKSIYEHPIEYFHVDGKEVQCGLSFYNIDEVDAIVCICDKLVNKEILILTFYNAQLDKLRNIINNEKIRICSIDSAQGMESDIVIISLVRTKFSKFVCDNNRICVLLSRAKYKLIIIGNISNIVKNSNIWNRIIKYVDNLK